jgi:hypothetical protein
MFIVAIIALSLMGYLLRPMFFIMDGVVILAFAFWAYTQTSDLIVTAGLLMFGLGVLLWGLIYKPPVKSKKG